MATAKPRRREARTIRSLAAHHQRVALAGSTLAAMAVRFDRVRRIAAAADPQLKAQICDQVGRYLDAVADTHGVPRRRGRR